MSKINNINSEKINLLSYMKNDLLIIKSQNINLLIYIV